MNLELYRRVAMETAVEAGRLLQGRIGKTEVRFKGEINPVTDADLESEKLCKERLLGAFPETDYLGEEGASRQTGSDLMWVVDPLDGTSNYSHSIPIYSVSIALRKKNEVVLGVVYSPTLREMFVAEKGKGSTCNGIPIRVSQTCTLRKSILATGFPYDRRENPINNLDHFCELTMETQGVRRFGSAAIDLSWVAAGRFDGYWEMRLGSWDVDAGMLIVREAGGVVTDFAGGPPTDPPQFILASNGILHGLLMEALSRHP